MEHMLNIQKKCIFYNQIKELFRKLWFLNTVFLSKKNKQTNKPNHIIHKRMDSRYSDLRSISLWAVHTELQYLSCSTKQKNLLNEKTMEEKKLPQNPPLRTNTPQDTSSKISYQTILSFSKSSQAYQLVLFFCNSLSPAAIWGNEGLGY